MHKWESLKLFYNHVTRVFTTKKNIPFFSIPMSIIVVLSTTFDSTSCWTAHICASYDGISNNLYYPMTSTLLLMHVLFSAYKSGRVRWYMGSLAFQKVSPLGYEHIMLSAHSIKPRPIGCLRLEGIFYKYTTPLVP